MRTRSITDEIRERAIAYVDRRGGAGMRRGGRGRGSSSKLKDRYAYALSNFASGNLYATPASGGERGTTGGFGVTSLIVVANQNLASASRMLVCNRTATANGWHKELTGANATIRFGLANGAAMIQSPAYTIAPSDVGRILCVTGLYDAAGGLSRLFVGPNEVGTGTAIASYVLSSGSHGIGGIPGRTDFNAPGSHVLESVSFQGVPSAAQIAAYALDARAKGRLGATIGGATITHRWPDPKLLKGLTDGPATIPDVVTGAAADLLTKTGTPSVVAIDLSRDGRASRGVLGFTSQGSRLQTANGAGIRGSTSGFHVRAVIVPGLLSGDGYIAACSTSSGTNGWSWLKNGANLKMYLGNASTAVVPVTSVIPAAWLHTPHVVEFVFDGANAWQVLDGVATAPVAVAGGAFGLAAASLPMTVGAMVGGSWPLPDAVYAFAGSNTVPTTAESAAAFETWRATGKLPRTGHASEHWYDLTADLTGLDAVPAQVLDRAGTDHLSRIGTDLRIAQRVERVWGHEASPIIHGVTDLSVDNFYSSPDGFLGDAAPWWISALVIFLKVSGVTSTTRFVAARRGTTGRGYSMHTTGANTLLTWSAVDAGGNPSTAPSYTLTAADIGRVHLVTGAFDIANKARLFIKRGEQGTGGTALGAYAPATAESFFLGKRADGLPADNMAILGFAAGYGNVTLAQYQAQYDAVSSSERMEVVPGTTPANLYRINPAGGVLPATIMDLIGSAHLARSGSPSLHAQYARAMAA